MADGPGIGRTLQAVKELAALAGTRIRTVLLVPAGVTEAQWIGESDAAFSFEPSDPSDVVRALDESGVEVLYCPITTVEGLGEIADKAGLQLLGPRPDLDRTFREPEGFATLVAAAGLETGDPAAADAIEVDVAGDGLDAVRALGARRCTEAVAGVPSLATSLPLDGLAAQVDAARRVWQATRIRGIGTVRIDPTEDRSRPGAIDVVPGPLSTTTEVMTGLDLWKESMHIALGAPLPRLEPGRSGASAAAALRCEPGGDEGVAHVDLLRTPGGPGIRVDASVAEGAVVPGLAPLSVVTAFGSEPGEVLARLAGALERMRVAVRGRITNRPKLIRSISSERSQEGDARAALLLAAVEEFDRRHTARLDWFLQSAARGRPAGTGLGGSSVELGFGGHHYTVNISQTGPREYELRVGGARVPINVVRDGPFGRSLRSGILAIDALVSPFPDGWLIETPRGYFRVRRADAGVVVAPAPAVVIDVRVAPGDRVAVGDTVVVLEAMKMEMTVGADRAGIVRSVVGTHVQVSPGTPLVTIDGEDDQPTEAQPLSFGPLAVADPVDPCRRASMALRRLMLGYDVEPADSSGLPALWGEACAGPPGPELIEAEDEALATFADLCSLSGEGVRSNGGQLVPARAEPFLLYLRTLDLGRSDLSPRFVAALERLLVRHDCRARTRTPALEEAVFRIHRAYRGIAVQVPTITAILDRSLAAIDETIGRTDPEVRATLDTIVATCHRTYPGLADLAREVRYRVFDEPVLEVVRDAFYEEADRWLDHLETAELDTTVAVASLVACPQPLKGTLIGRLRTAGDSAKRAILETLIRRYYRIRSLENIRTERVGDRMVALAEYDHDGSRVHLIATFAAESEFAQAAAALVPMVERAPAGEEVITDYYLWQGDGGSGGDAESARIVDVLDRAGFGRTIRRAVVTISPPRGSGGSSERHFTFRHRNGRFHEEELYRGLHPMMGKRLELWRLRNFWIDRLPSVEDVYLFHGTARDNPKDERLFALTEVRDLTPVRNEEGRIVGLPHLERMLHEAFAAIRVQQSHRPPGKRLPWNRVFLYVWPPIDLDVDELFGIIHRLAPETEGLGLQKVVVRGRWRDADTGELTERVLHVANPIGSGLTMRFADPASEPIRPLTDYMQKVVRCRQRGLVYPYEIVDMLTGPEHGGDFPAGSFTEYDLEGERIVPVERPYGNNTANIIVGVVSNISDAYPEGMRRVAILGDPSRALGSLAEPECRRINAALDLAEELGMPAEWFAISAGAKISMESGSENMDWIARVLRRIIEYTQAGGELNVVVCGINVGAQPYWNAEATMLMHTKGILVMTPESAMVLTGKQALDYSGGVSADDNFGIGGYDRIMGPNGQAQYWAPDLAEACHILLRHYEHTYVAPGERFPRRVDTTDPIDRDVAGSPHQGEGLATVGNIFSASLNPERKHAFDIRSVMAGVVDRDRPSLERWQDMVDAETVVVWDAHLGGRPVCLLGIESKPLPRRGFVSAEGPDVWTAGTLFPRSSKKAARAINAASDRRPVVVLANLTGFDGSPESLRELQLEFGAEIGRAVVNFRGPFVFCVVSRYHGGAFVVFSAPLNESIEVAAVEGSYASVIGGAPAAAVVFARDVDARTAEDERVREAERRLAEATDADRGRLRRERDAVVASVRSDHLGEVAREFDHIHSIHRAQRVGSVHRIIPASQLRPYLVDAVERGIARELERGRSS